MGIYSVKHLFTKQPVAIATAIRSVLFVLVLGQVLQLSVELLAGIALSLELILGLFVNQTTNPKNGSGQAE